MSWHVSYCERGGADGGGGDAGGLRLTNEAIAASCRSTPLRVLPSLNTKSSAWIGPEHVSLPSPTPVQ
eukprot:scaffold17613_cov59-Phaeocystis_antarctica.AAC.1